MGSVLACIKSVTSTEKYKRVKKKTRCSVLIRQI